MDRDRKTSQLSTDDQLAQVHFLSTLSQTLSFQEVVDISKRFQSDHWVPNGQVLWSGVPHSIAQAWADGHHLQTLTTAMGPLMNENHPDCLKSKKTTRQWSRYIHGASAVFAWYIAQGEKVTLLSPPPPERFHPSGLSYYQVLEEPIIMGLVGRSAVDKIITAHPTVKESEEYLYELWPNDEGDDWLQKFGSRCLKKNWRHTGHNMEKLKSQMVKSVPERYGQRKTTKVAHIEPARNVLLVTMTLILLKKLPLLLLVGLLYSLVDKIWGLQQQSDQAFTVEENRIATPLAKAQQEAAKKLKVKKKSEAKAQQEAAKKLKVKKKAEAKAQQEAAKNLKVKKKAEAKAQQEAAKKLKDRESTSFF